MKSEEFSTLYEQAFQTTTPFDTLRNTVIDLLKAGCERKEVIESLTEYFLLLRKEGRDSDEDLVLDLLDQMTGWSNPDLAI